MDQLIDILERQVTLAIEQVTGEASPALVKPSQQERFGDYQVNGVMALAKKLKKNPRQLAEEIVSKLELSEICEPPEIAGPGFINLRLRPEWLGTQLVHAIRDPQRLGISKCEHAPVTVVDYSGPNLAKEMHVGHLRSTIIGDVITRVLRFWYGDDRKVIPQNHVGDWGTQFGMLAAFLARQKDQTELNIPDMEAFYRQAKQRFDDDPSFADQARQYVVRLQGGDPLVNKQWQAIVDQSLTHAEAIYRQLGVTLKRSDVRGESFYNPFLTEVVQAITEQGLLEESDGAECVFLEGFKGKDGSKLPLIVQKSDGAYLYATTDLAAIRFRTNQLTAGRIIYVTDSRQKLHFDMVFACARKTGWAEKKVSLEHVAFGSVLGPDGKPFKTRSGEQIKLKDLLDEACLRALAVVEEKNPQLDTKTKNQIAEVVGVGAVKYADLSNHLTSDYVFDWDKMLAMDGNTAPYMQYAYARIQSIFRKGGIQEETLLAQVKEIQLNEPEERQLGKLLLQYGQAVAGVVRDLKPHLLTGYLFDLAQAFSAFYTNCPVLKAPDEQTRSSRLLLCGQTARTIRHGLELLGIQTIEQM